MAFQLTTTSSAKHTDASRMMLLLYGDTKTGKSTFALGLDEICQKHMDGKRAVVLAGEQAQGAGIPEQFAATGDIPMYVMQPPPYANLDKFEVEVRELLSTIRNDATYGGVLFDAFDMFFRYVVKPAQLERSVPGKNETQQLRKQGVPADKDYQAFGSIMEIYCQHFALLTQAGKHVVVTCNLREVSNEQRQVIARVPNFPGAMSGPILQSTFKTIASYELGSKTVDRERRITRTFSTDRSALDAIRGDRTNVFPLTWDKTFLELYEQCWLPKMVA